MACGTWVLIFRFFFPFISKNMVYTVQVYKLYHLIFRDRPILHTYVKYVLGWAANVIGFVTKTTIVLWPLWHMGNIVCYDAAALM